MARYELLNNVTHGQLRVITRFGPQFGDGIGMLPAFPTEFAELQKEYPIFLRRDRESDEFQSVALLGFEQHENLYLRDERWDAAYLPGAIARGPFLIGFQERSADGELLREPVIHVDMEHPRVSLREGEPVFLPHGGHSPYLAHIVTVLRGIHDGAQGGKAMFAALDALGLIQPVNLDVRFDSESGVKVGGLYGIDRERLSELDSESLYRLHRAGWLEGAFLMLASMHNVRRLMAEKQRRMRQPMRDPASTERVA